MPVETCQQIIYKNRKIIIIIIIVLISCASRSHGCSKPGAFSQILLGLITPLWGQEYTRDIKVRT